MVANKATSGPKSAAEQNATRRASKARQGASARATAASKGGPRSSGSLFQDVRTDGRTSARGHKRDEFLTKGREYRRQASKDILEAGFANLQHPTARKAATRAIELYGTTDPQVAQRSEGEVHVIVSSFKLAVLTVRDELNDDNNDEQDVQDGIDAAGRALEAYRNDARKIR